MTLKFQLSYLAKMSYSATQRLSSSGLTLAVTVWLGSLKVTLHLFIFIRCTAQGSIYIRSCCNRFAVWVNIYKLFSGCRLQPVFWSSSGCAHEQTNFSHTKQKITCNLSENTHFHYCQLWVAGLHIHLAPCLKHLFLQCWPSAQSQTHTLLPCRHSSNLVVI